MTWMVQSNTFLHISDKEMNWGVQRIECTGNISWQQSCALFRQGCYCKSILLGFSQLAKGAHSVLSAIVRMMFDTPRAFSRGRLCEYCLGCINTHQLKYMDYVCLDLKCTSGEKQQKSKLKWSFVHKLFMDGCVRELEPSSRWWLFV